MSDASEICETPEKTASGANPEELLTNLTKAWQERADGIAGGPGAVVRTSTLSLVIYSGGARAAERAEAIMPDLTAAVACRVVHIVADDDRTAPLTATSHVHARTENGVRTIACEQVTLKGGVSALDSLQGAVAPLLSPDLPVVLWWRGDPPFEGSLFETLVQAADRVIFDSSYFVEPEDDLPWALTLLEHHVKLDVACTDVNWARLTPWRGLVAQFFDGSANMSGLEHIDRVTVEYADPLLTDDRAAVQAWLLTGWLGSRLRWGATARAPWGGTPTFSVRAPHGEVCIALKRQSSDGPPGLRAVELHAAGPQPMTCRVELQASGECIRTVTLLEGRPPLERIVGADAQSYEQLIADELAMPGHDAVYTDALRFTVQLLPHAPEACSPS